MNITNMKITEVIPYEKNTRINEAAVEAVAKSLKEFGWQQPIVVDKDHVIIVGHTRLRAAESLGLTEVPVVVADHLMPDKVIELFQLRTPHFAKMCKDGLFA